MTTVVKLKSGKKAANGKSIARKAISIAKGAKLLRRKIIRRPKRKAKVIAGPAKPKVIAEMESEKVAGQKEAMLAAAQVFEPFDTPSVCLPDAEPLPTSPIKDHGSFMVAPVQDGSSGSWWAGIYIQPGQRDLIWSITSVSSGVIGWSSLGDTNSYAFRAANWALGRVTGHGVRVANVGPELYRGGLAYSMPWQVVNAYADGTNKKPVNVNDIIFNPSAVKRDLADPKLEMQFTTVWIPEQLGEQQFVLPTASSAEGPFLAASNGSVVLYQLPFGDDSGSAMFPQTLTLDYCIHMEGLPISVSMPFLGLAQSRGDTATFAQTMRQAPAAMEEVGMTKTPADASKPWYRQVADFAKDVWSVAEPVFDFASDFFGLFKSHERLSLIGHLGGLEDRLKSHDFDEKDHLYIKDVINDIQSLLFISTRQLGTRSGTLLRQHQRKAFDLLSKKAPDVKEDELHRYHFDVLMTTNIPKARSFVGRPKNLPKPELRKVVPSETKAPGAETLTDPELLVLARRIANIMRPDAVSYNPTSSDLGSVLSPRAAALK